MTKHTADLSPNLGKCHKDIGYMSLTLQLPVKCPDDEGSGKLTGYLVLLNFKVSAGDRQTQKGSPIAMSIRFK